jgi:hypothetical protein
MFLLLSKVSHQVMIPWISIIFNCCSVFFPLTLIQRRTLNPVD